MKSSLIKILFELLVGSEHRKPVQWFEYHNSNTKSLFYHDISNPISFFQMTRISPYNLERRMTNGTLDHALNSIDRNFDHVIFVDVKNVACGRCGERGIKKRA